MQWGKTMFVYQDDGVSITIPGVPAWVCPQCGDESFTPDVTDQLIATLKEFTVAAKHARERQPILAEYLVQVAA